MKKKLLLVILFCLCIAGMVTARQLREVINVDLNVNSDANAYSGKAAGYDTNNALYDDGISTWQTYYKNKSIRMMQLGRDQNDPCGFGIPVGSPRSSHLTDCCEPNNPAIYASQVWMEDVSANSAGFRNTSYASPGLMNDGLQKTGGTGDPNIRLWGLEAYATGIYDIYVYGPEAGNITLTQWDPNVTGIEPNKTGYPIRREDPNTYRGNGRAVKYDTVKALTGSYDPMSSSSYVKFDDVRIALWTADYNTWPGQNENDHNVITITSYSPREAWVSYSNKISGLQLVRKNRDPYTFTVPVSDFNTPALVIPAALYMVAGERTGRIAQGGAGSFFGPSVITEANWPSEGGKFMGNNISRVERREFMEYDLYVDQNTKGKYRIEMDCDPATDGEALFRFDLDDVNLGTVYRVQAATHGESSPVEVNLVPGYHTLRWMHPGYDSSSTGYNVMDVNFHYVENQTGYPGIIDCNGVVYYGQTVAQDLNKDCYVNRKDLDIMTEMWLECDDPVWTNCK